MVPIEIRPFEEDLDEEPEEEEWLDQVRHEVVEFILRKYGTLRSRDIAKILNWKVKEVNQVLKTLESWGRVKRARLGRTQAWCHVEEVLQNHMYY